MGPLFAQYTLMQISTRSPSPLPTFKPKIIMLGKIMRNHLLITELVARAGFILDALIRHGPAILDIFRGKTTVDGIEETISENQRRTFFVRLLSHVAFIIAKHFISARID